MSREECKDCLEEGITSKRPLARRLVEGVLVLEPGPRCVTHHRRERRRLSAAAHARRLVATYQMTPEQYRAIYDLQNGHCAICRKSTGAARRLAVDHDHETGEVRGLLCKFCNTYLIGRCSAETLVRAVQYLTNPPARRILGEGL